MARKHRQRRPRSAAELDKAVAPDPSGKTVILTSNQLEGLILKISGATPRKRWYLNKRIDGRTRWLPVGDATILSHAEAVIKAKALLKDLYAGADPAQRLSTTTLKEALALYLRSPELAASSKHAYGYAIERYLADWLPRPLAALSKPDILDRYQSIMADVRGRDPAGRRSGISSANLAMAGLSAVWHVAVDAGLVAGDSPVTALRRRVGSKGGVKRLLIKRRRTLISDQQLAELWRAITELRTDDPVTADCLQLIVFTGLRRTSAEALTWSEVDFKDRCLRFSAARMKARRPFLLPLPPRVFDMLMARHKQRIRDNDHVFPSMGRSRVPYITHTNDALGMLCRGRGVVAVEYDEAGVEVRRETPSLNDLRRNFIKVADQVAGIYGAKSLAGHGVAPGDITQGYRPIQPDERRAMMVRIAKKIEGLCRIKPRLADAA